VLFHEQRICLKIKRSRTMQKDFQVESSIYSQDSVISAIEDFSEVTQITFEKDILSIS